MQGSSGSLVQDCGGRREIRAESVDSPFAAFSLVVGWRTELVRHGELCLEHRSPPQLHFTVLPGLVAASSRASSRLLYPRRTLGVL